jgi:hypothetical protein
LLFPNTPLLVAQLTTKPTTFTISGSELGLMVLGGSEIGAELGSDTGENYDTELLSIKEIHTALSYSLGSH